MNQTCSLQPTDALITVASWETRFVKGINSFLESQRPRLILMFYYEEYEKLSKEHREVIIGTCEKHGVKMVDKILSFGSALESWKSVVSAVKQTLCSIESVTLDVSTMPREAIWSICHVLSQYPIAVQFTYHRPKSYGDWLSRDPGRPRIVYRLAGIQHLGRPTALMIQTGYDPERIKQLIKFFEPDRILLGLQTGSQFGNNEKNRNKYKKIFGNRKDTTIFDIDGYSLENSYKTLGEYLIPVMESHNILLTSLGPKVGALALHKVKHAYPDVALCYAPSNEFNPEYSEGIGDCIYGTLQTRG